MHNLASATMIAVVHFREMFSNRDAALGLYIAYVALIGVVLIVLEVIKIRGESASWSLF